MTCVCIFSSWQPPFHSLRQTPEAKTALSRRAAVQLVLVSQSRQTTTEGGIFPKQPAGKWPPTRQVVEIEDKKNCFSACPVEEKVKAAFFQHPVNVPARPAASIANHPFLEPAHLPLTLFAVKGKIIRKRKQLKNNGPIS